MSKSKTSITKDFENPMADGASGRGKGIFATLVVLSVVGLIVWLVMSNQES
jgi:di/tricarboxylate transporter